MKITRYLIACFFVFLFTGCGPVRCGSDDDCLRVLFVGNSYTYVNDLPETFSELARSGGHKVEVSIVAEGGFSFEDHAKSAAFTESLTASQWDYVVMQEQSQTPSVEDWRVHFMYPAARTLVKQIRASNAQPLFFSTWAHRDGFPENGMKNYESMQYQIDQGYLRIARELNVPVVPVGVAWFRALNTHPNLQLWQEDGSHPSEQGTYLAASVFYVTLFKESPVGLNYHANLTEEVASQLQSVAESILTNP
mgnify:CR=1 FL=1